MLYSFGRIIKFALQDFWRNFWLSLVTITVLMLALFTINILISLNAISNTLVKSVEEKVDISITFKPAATQAEIDNFKASLDNMDEVTEIVYITKDQTLEEFKKKNSDNAEIQEAVNELKENPFTDSLVIKAEKAADYEKILEKLQTPESEKLIENKNFSDPQRIISFVKNINTKAEKFGLILTVIFALISILIVFNTIRVIIYTHKEEIGIMRLVGAPNWFIRAPFLIEGVIYAIIAIGLQVLLLYAALTFVQPYMSSLLQNYNFNLIEYFRSNFIQIFGLELGAVIFLNIISSGFAIRKYLKV